MVPDMLSNFRGVHEENGLICTDGCRGGSKSEYCDAVIKCKFDECENECVTMCPVLCLRECLLSDYNR